MGKPSITSRQIDSTADLVRARVRKITEITAEEYQRFLSRGAEFQDIVEETIREFACGRHADEEVSSTYTYPPEYTGLKPVRDQVELLMKHFPNLDPAWALEKGQAWYDSLKPEFPDWVEGPLVYVWRAACCESPYLASIALGSGPRPEGWEASYLQLVLEKLASTRLFQNYRQGQLSMRHLKQTELTETMEYKLHTIQPGSFLVVPSQAGLRYRGKSVRRARELFIRGEFGHGSLAVSCLALTHPERFVRWNQLQADCAGDEFFSNTDGVFRKKAPYFVFSGSRLGFGVGDIDDPDGSYGSASAFLPQNLAIAS